MAVDTLRSRNLEFTIGEVSKFLSRTVYWIREQEKAGRFRTESNKRIEPARTTTHKNGGPGQRRYTLKDIEAMARSLHRYGTFTDGELERTLRRVQAFRE